MNQTIEKMLQHVTVRDYKNEPLTQDIKDVLVKAAQSGSSSNFMQTYSIIEVEDKKLKEVICEISGSGNFIKEDGTLYIFIADLYRHSVILEKQGMSLEPLENVESLIVSIVDATIAAQNMTVAAESLGLGICYLGSIRNGIDKIGEMLQLPKYTLPVYGLYVGQPNVINEQKPRLPKHNILSNNTYNTSEIPNFEEYDKTMLEYYSTRPLNPKEKTYTQEIENFFDHVRRPEVTTFLKKQGFTFR